MPAPRNEFVDYCIELLGAAGTVRSRRMFGGHGFYVDELFVAIADGEQLFLKADETARPAFESAGCVPFAYRRDGELTTMGYWTVPAEAMDSPASMQPWARLAMAAAVRARAAKRSR
ncbi:TfoX/Sxy family protein [soil metagenome]